MKIPTSATHGEKSFCPPNVPRLKPGAIPRQQQKRFLFKKLVLFMVLVLLVLGTAGFVFQTPAPLLYRPEPALPVAPSNLSQAVAPTPVPAPADVGLPSVKESAPAAPPALSAAGVLPASPISPTLTTTLQSEVQHVVIISIDGLRPDALDLTYTPTLDTLRARGAFCPIAQTIRLSETLPGHASMLSGMRSDKHGIHWGVPYIGWPGMNGPTVFSVARGAGLTTGMVFGKQKLHYLVLSNSVNKLFGADVHDPEIKEWAIEFIETGLPQILFIHFPDTDRVGHTYGWLSTNQLQSITFVDGLIGEIVAVLENGGYLSSTLIIVTSDHGGHDRVHGNDSPEDRTIPWLAAGPGVSPGMILNRPVNIYDTAATVLHVFELPIPEKWDGQPVLDIFLEETSYGTQNNRTSSPVSGSR